MRKDYKKHFSDRIPSRVKEFAYEIALSQSRYIFFKANKGIDECYCTHCHKHFKSEGLKHNEIDRCPKCGTLAKTKNLRYKRGRLIDEACFITYDKSHYDNSLIAREFLVSIDYSGDYEKTKMKFFEMSRYLFRIGKDAKMFSKEYANYYYINTPNNNWHETISIYLNSNQGHYNTIECYTDYNSLDRIIADTDFKYSMYDEYIKHKNNERLLEYFELYSKYPIVESLTKMGFDDLIAYKLDNGSLEGAVNWRGKNVFAFLKMNRAEVKEILGMDFAITPRMIEVFKKCVRNNYKFTSKQMIDYDLMLNHFDYKWRFYDAVHGNTTLRDILIKTMNDKKIVKYLEKQSQVVTAYEKEHYDKKSASRFIYNFDNKAEWEYDIGDIMGLWHDYYRSCEKLKMNVNDIHVLMPKNIKIAHDNLLKQIELEKNEKLDIGIKSRLEKYSVYNFEFNGIFTRVMQSAAEVRKEGKELSHCVATHYLEPYAEGKTIILCIRKKDDPDTPWVTMEVRENVVRQVYGIRDTQPPREVKEFVEEYKKQVLSKCVKKNSKKNKRKKVA